MSRTDPLEPPNDIQAEQSVLGSVLLGTEDAVVAAIGCMDILGGSDAFYREGHRRIWRAVEGLLGAAQPIDVVTVQAELERRGDLQAAGGMGYLVDLASATPTAANAEAYARIVAECARRRRLVGIAARLRGAAMDGAEESERLVEAIQRELLQLASSPSEREPVQAGKIVAAEVSRLEDLARTGKADGISSGFTALHRWAGTWLPGDLVVLSTQRSSQGKTSWSIQAARWVADHHGPVLVCMVEMGYVQTAKRLLTMLTGRSSFQFREWTDADWRAARGAADDLSDRLWVDEAAHTTAQVIAHAHRLAVRSGEPPALVVVDGLNDLRDRKEKNQSREEVVANATQSLKDLAQQLGCVVLLTTHPDKQGGLAERKPVVSDLRESNRIGDIADMVIFPWFDPKEIERAQDGVVKGEFIVAKSRLGWTGSVPMVWRRRFVRFEQSTQNDGRWRQRNERAMAQGG